MITVLETLEKIGIVPVIKIDDAEKAVPLAKALAAGGIPCAEITFRTAQGEEAVRRIAKEAPDVLLGAGTVLTTEQVDCAIGAGAQFIVSPGFNPRVVEYCIQKGIPIIPGCANPSDVERALEFGLEVVKFFPAEQAGGLKYIKAISAPYANLKFIPTGGINAGNVAKYIAFEKILACGGSWMADSDLINAGEFEKIAALSREAMLTMLGFTVMYVGTNAKGDEAAIKAAQLLSSMFGFVSMNGTNSIFTGDSTEALKASAPGAHLHIAVGTNSIARAVAWLERNGIEIDHAGAKKDAKGGMIAVCLKETILGFAVHLHQIKK